MDLLLPFIPPRPKEAFPPSSPRSLTPHPDTAGMRRAPASPTSSLGKGLGKGCPAEPPQMSGRLVGMSWGWQGLCPSCCTGLAAAGLSLPVPLLRRWDRGRAWRGRDETWSGMPLTWWEQACGQAGRSRQGGRKAGNARPGSSAAPWLPSPLSQARRLTGSLQPLSGLTGWSLSLSPFA